MPTTPTPTSSGTFQNPFDLTTLNGVNGFVVPGLGSLGYSVSTAGDINGDSISDLILGAPGVSTAYLTSAGAAYVLFGNHGGFASPFNLSSLNGTNGFTIPGLLSDDSLGSLVSTVGDINGDGISDLVVVSSGIGIASVIFGSRGKFPSAFNINNLNGNNGFLVSAPAPKHGVALAEAAGDINGDDIEDLLLADCFSAYIIFGSRGGFPPTFNLNNLNETNGFVILGNYDFYFACPIGAGRSAGTTAGDVNGDGVGDIILGDIVVNSLTGLQQAGAAYVIFGRREGFVSPFNINNLNGTNGFVIPGLVTDGHLGRSVNTAGDINADGISDLILGSDSNAGYVIFGSRRGFASTFNLNNLNGTNGFMIPGLSEYDGLGYSVSTTGDINGDAITDLVLSASGAYSTGAVYVIFGSRGGFQSSLYPSYIYGESSVISAFDLNSLDGSNGFIIPGLYFSTSDQSVLCVVNTAGDINGDGIGDLVLGAPYSLSSPSPGAGVSYVIFGSNTSLPVPIPAPTFTPTPPPTTPGSTPTSAPTFTPTPPPTTPGSTPTSAPTFTPMSPPTTPGSTPYPSTPAFTPLPPSTPTFAPTLTDPTPPLTPSVIPTFEPTSTPTFMPSAIEANQSSTSSSPETTANTSFLIGGIVGGIVGFGALMGLGYGIYRKYRGNSPDELKLDPAVAPLSPREKIKMGMADDGNYEIPEIPKIHKPF